MPIRSLSVRDRVAYLVSTRCAFQPHELPENLVDDQLAGSDHAYVRELQCFVAVNHTRPWPKPKADDSKGVTTSPSAVDGDMHGGPDVRRPSIAARSNDRLTQQTTIQEALERTHVWRFARRHKLSPRRNIVAENTRTISRTDINKG